jgi:hypothetical protein
VRALLEWLREVVSIVRFLLVLMGHGRYWS